jgi:hypothetical protein
MSQLLKTPLGHVAVTPTDNNHVHIEIAPTSPTLDQQGRKFTLPFQVRGVLYHGSLHVYRWEDGQFHLGPQSSSSYEQRQSIYLRRSNPSHPSNDHASNAAERTILQVLIPLANAWAAANPYALDAAEHERTERDLVRLRGQRAELQKQLAGLDAQIAALLPRYTGISAPDHMAQAFCDSLSC